METKAMSIYEEIQALRKREWKELADVVRKYGEEHYYKNGCHWIGYCLKRQILIDVSGSGFGCGNPGTVAVTEVILDPECEITVKGYEKDDFTGTIYSFEGSSFYPGELSFITERIIEEQK